MSSRHKYVVDQVLAAVATATGQMYLENFATEIGELADTDYVAIAVLADDGHEHLQTLVVCHKGQLADNLAWPLTGSPAAEIVANTAPCTFRSRVQERFPEDPVLRRTGVQSYIGIPLLATGGHTLGVVILMDRRPIADDLFIINVIQLFADRLVAEIERPQREPHSHEEVRRLKNELHRCRTDLQATRSELEAFSHAVSHDLRGPLRAIDGFSETLAADHAADLDDTARDYLRRIRINADQMNRMVSAFLAVSRVIRHPLQASTLDLSQTAHKLLARSQRVR
jgi:signal transduction histidine kinase